jgi:hypothetical protein
VDREYPCAVDVQVGGLLHLTNCRKGCHKSLYGSGMQPLVLEEVRRSVRVAVRFSDGHVYQTTPCTELLVATH